MPEVVDRETCAAPMVHTPNQLGQHPQSTMGHASKSGDESKGPDPRTVRSRMPHGAKIPVDDPASDLICSGVLWTSPMCYTEYSLYPGRPAVMTLILNLPIRRLVLVW
ncbi:hypothetical protein IAQ61_002153 [Plenodomus lingam]|uniref:uncharacterized protein n=1 Tax=Leptosphaeria maculans TaxID=5022 RepID=UPI00331C4092|nr:hypothetical protein IAQ61_002153 [Plenodomus lingam]